MDTLLVKAKSLYVKCKKNIPFAIAFLGLALIIAANHIYKNNSSQNTSFENKNKLSAESAVQKPANPAGFALLWWTDFNHNRVVGFTPDGKVVWEQNMSAPPIPRSSWYYIGGVERVTVAPNGNLIASYGDAMIVEELDRKTHDQVWQYGTTGVQTYRGGSLDEPHKAYKFNDHEVVINDSNDRLVKVVDQNTNQVVWQYGEYHVVGTGPGILEGNTSVLPLDGGQQFMITETLANRIILVDRATKNIVWQFTKPDAKWLENVSPTPDGNFVLSDRLNGDVFEVNRDGKIVWDLTRLSDEDHLSYPTDTAVLDNGDILIAEAGKSRIVEVTPATGQVVRQYIIHGLVSTIAIDQNGLDPNAPPQNIDPQSLPQTIVVNDFVKSNPYATGGTGGGQNFSGKVMDVNASTGRSGAFSIEKDGTNYGVEVYNYSRVINKNGTILSLDAVEKGDDVFIQGTISGTFIQASLVQDESR